MPHKCWCGNTELELYSNEYMKCDVCKTLVSKKNFNESIYHVQDEVQDLYGANYWKSGMLEQAGVDSLDELHNLYLTHRAPYWMSFLLQYVRSVGKVAEIGGGLGQFSYMLKSAGFDQINFEMSPEICRYGEETFDIHAFCGDIGDTDDIFDVVVAFDLIEHILDVDNFTARVASHLSEDGVLCLQTPCYDDSMAYEDMLRDNPEFNTQLKYDEHIFVFSRSSMQRLLKKHGFEYIQFESAVFGDNYDMFLFAGKKPLVKRSPEEIVSLPLDKGNGYLVRALAKLSIKSIETISTIKRQADRRLEDVITLTAAIGERDKNLSECRQQLEAVNAESVQRLEDVNTLTAAIGERDKSLSECRQQLEVVSAESVQHLEDVNALTAAIGERDKSLSECRKQLEAINAESIQRMEDINTLTAAIRKRDEQLTQYQKQLDEIRLENEKHKQDISSLQEVASWDKRFIQVLETEKAGLETRAAYKFFRFIKMVK